MVRQHHVCLIEVTPFVLIATSVLINACMSSRNYYYYSLCSFVIMQYSYILVLSSSKIY